MSDEERKSYDIDDRKQYKINIHSCIMAVKNKLAMVKSPSTVPYFDIRATDRTRHQ